MRTLPSISLVLLPTLSLLPGCQGSLAEPGLALPAEPVQPSEASTPKGASLAAQHGQLPEQRGTDPAWMPSGAKELEALASELKEMMRLDQLHRTPVSWGTQDEAELARLEALDDAAQLEETKRRWREGVSLPEDIVKDLMGKQEVLDRANLERLVELIGEHGYPDAKRLGIEAPTVVPILIHAQLEDYAAHEELFREEALAGRMPPKEYAALTDRKLQHFGEVQLYGTSSRYDSASNTVLPPEIEDIEVTNRARRELGLEPLEDYLLADAD